MFKEISIKKRVIIALAFVFVASTALTAYVSYARQSSQLQESLQDLALTQGKLFESIIAADAEGLSRAHTGIDRLDAATAVADMNIMTRSVALATAEQRKGGEAVVVDMENISAITRDNLSSVEQLSGAAQTLSRQAEEMAALVAVFKVA